MSQPIINPTPAQHSFRDLPEAVQVLLRDEANLSTARHVLEDARNDAFVRQDELQQSRPKIGLLMSKQQREELATAAATLQGQIQVIEAMLARVAAARERLQAPLRTLLLHHMEQADPLYKQGLRASRFHEHWRRGHSLVIDRLQGFLRDLKVARASLGLAASKGQLNHTEETNWSITTLHGAGTALDLEIERLNHWAIEHAACVKGTHFARVQLPQLEQWSCVARTEMLGRSTPAAAYATVEALYAEFIEYRQPSLATLTGMFQAAADEHSQIAEARLRQRWSQYLNYAECHLVTDSELEPTLADIEKRLSSSERARLTAQLPFDPFTAER